MSKFNLGDKVYWLSYLGHAKLGFGTICKMELTYNDKKPIAYAIEDDGNNESCCPQTNYVWKTKEEALREAPKVVKQWGSDQVQLINKNTQEQLSKISEVS